MSKEFDHDWFDKHVIVDFGDFNNKEDKKKADDLKDKLKEELEKEFRNCLLYTSPSPRDPL